MNEEITISNSTTSPTASSQSKSRTGGTATATRTSSTRPASTGMVTVDVHAEEGWQVLDAMKAIRVYPHQVTKTVWKSAPQESTPASLGMLSETPLTDEQRMRLTEGSGAALARAMHGTMSGVVTIGGSPPPPAASIRVRTDASIPRDEVRIEQDGRLLGVFKIEDAGAPNTPDGSSGQ